MWGRGHGPVLTWPRRVAVTHSPAGLVAVQWEPRNTARRSWGSGSPGSLREAELRVGVHLLLQGTQVRQRGGGLCPGSDSFPSASPAHKTQFNCKTAGEDYGHGQGRRWLVVIHTDCVVKAWSCYTNIQTDFMGEKEVWVIRQKRLAVWRGHTKSHLDRTQHAVSCWQVPGEGGRSIAPSAVHRLVLMGGREDQAPAFPAQNSGEDGVRR